MGRSSTTFSGKWRSGKTTVVRVPQSLASRVIEYARALDAQEDFVRDPEAIYRTATHFALDQPINVAAVPHRSPFRYPGGKTWLVPYVRSWLNSLQPKPQLLIEPFAGGGIVGLTAGIERLADHVIFVERDEDVAAVWKVILSGQAEWLAQKIEEFTLTKTSALTVLRRTPRNPRERAFATIIRNRVQRGGIMAAGAGLVKSGENGRGLSSRWYPQTLANRIRTIATMRERFSFIEGDGMEVIQSYARDRNAAFFIDPPYTVAARRLYSHWQVDQLRLFGLLKRVEGSILLTYDSTAEILDLATEHGFETQAVAMKNTHHARMTELLVGKDLTWLRLAQASHGSRVQTAQATLAFPQ